MKLYRVHLLDKDGSSHGFQYFSNKQDAKTAGDGWGDMLADRGEAAAYTVNEINVEPTRPGILTALSLYGAHPDNG